MRDHSAGGRVPGGRVALRAGRSFPPPELNSAVGGTEGGCRVPETPSPEVRPVRGWQEGMKGLAHRNHVGVGHQIRRYGGLVPEGTWPRIVRVRSASVGFPSPRGHTEICCNRSAHTAPSRGRAALSQGECEVGSPFPVAASPAASHPWGGGLSGEGKGSPHCSPEPAETLSQRWSSRQMWVLQGGR